MINAFNSSNYTRPVTFKGQNKPVNKVSSPLKRTMPWIFSGLMIFGGGACSNGGQKVTGIENYKGINVEYTDVSKQTKDSVMCPIYELKDKLTTENDFLKGMKINIANDLEKIQPKDSFEKYVKENESDKSYKGTSFYSDSLLQRRIALQEKAFENNSSRYKSMRQTAMHEVGHHFDNFFGHDHNSDYALKWDSIMNAHDKSANSDLFTFQTVKKEDKAIEKLFYDNNALSDKEEFQNALFHDINNLKYQKELPKDLDYYLGNIDIKRGITRDKLKRADGVRSEIYANLFSYISGQNDGNREKFLDCFSDSKKIVEKDMKKFLKFIK